MQVLAEQLVERQVIAALADETVRRMLKKTSSSRGRRRRGAFPV
jgi:hypothetical protein